MAHMNFVKKEKVTWIGQGGATSMYNTSENIFIFVTVKSCVLFEVRTVFLNIIWTIFGWKWLNKLSTSSYEQITVYNVSPWVNSVTHSRIPQRKTPTPSLPQSYARPFVKSLKLSFSNPFLRSCIEFFTPRTMTHSLNLFAHSFRW